LNNYLEDNVQNLLVRRIVLNELAISKEARYILKCHLSNHVVLHLRDILEINVDSPHRIPCKRWQFLASEIGKLFPGEDEDIYYYPYKKENGLTIQQGGKLPI